MTREKFFTDLQDLLQCESPLEDDTKLTDLEEWDSVAFMSVITYFDKTFGQRITFDDLRTCRSIADLAALAGGAVA